jgi:hypothetical protein
MRRSDVGFNGSTGCSMTPLYNWAASPNAKTEDRLARQVMHPRCSGNLTESPDADSMYHGVNRRRSIT